MSHVVVDGHTKIGEDCMVYPYVTLGIASQDLKHERFGDLHRDRGPQYDPRIRICYSGTEPESTRKSAMIAPCSHIPMLLTTVQWVITSS